MDTLAFLIGERFAIARGASVSQDALAKVLGFNDRQTVSAIEVGERRVTPDELLKAARFFGKPLEFFTDPYLVPEKTGFSYRASTFDHSALQAFECQAEKLISAQRRFRAFLGDAANPVHAQLPDISKSTPLGVATYRGEQTAAAWGLGEVPAKQLRKAAEQRLDVSVFFVDAPEGISGAACFLSDGSVILINRHESVGRRNFNLGHELFHLLTWNRLPPDRFDQDGCRSRTEQLANAFTGGLLMPSAIVQDRWRKKGQNSLSAWLQLNATELEVSSQALYWRLVNLDLIDKDEEPFPALRPQCNQAAEPALYNEVFVSRLHRVLERGHLTVTRTLSLLDCSIEELGALFRAYDLTVPFDL